MLRNLILIVLAYAAYLIFKRFLSNRLQRKQNPPKQRGSAQSAKTHGRAVDADFEEMDD